MKQRIDGDFYPTKAKLTEKMLTHPMATAVMGGSQFVECCVGDGDIANVLWGLEPQPVVVTNDVNPDHPADYHMDATKRDFWTQLLREHGRLEWVITNPPYKLAPQIVANAYGYARRGVAMLLRLSFAEPCQNRLGFLTSFPPTALIVAGNPRPSFRPDGGTDSVTTAWFIWDKRADPCMGFITNQANKWDA